MNKILIISILVVILSVSVTSISAQSKYDIPAWVKGVAGFWSEGKITDSDFGEAISFLIEQKIIKVEMPIKDNLELQNKISQLESKNTALQNEVSNLKNENSQLKQQVNSLQNKESETSSQTNTSSKKGFSGLVCKKDFSGYVQLTGKYTSDRDYSFLGIEFGIIGDNGEILDTGLAMISNIKAGETKIFSAQSLYAGNFRSCEVQTTSGY